MAFLSPHFEYDVFVSYSHGNPNPRAGDDLPLKTWTNELIRDLEEDSRTIDPEFRDLHIWCDEQIDPTMQLSDELRRKVTNSCVLMIVMSPWYLRSNWCRDELEWFRQQVQDRAREQGRIFVVRAMPTDEKTWPDFLCDDRGHPLVGFPFHDPQEPTPYGWRGTRENNEAYVRQLRRLQVSLTKRLRELRDLTERRAEAQSAATDKPATGPKKVWLHARAEHRPVCEQVKQALSQDGIAPLSTIADPGRDILDWRKESRARIETAKHCDALALVRADTDERFLGDLLEIGVDERERIQSDRGKPLPCAVLDHSGEKLPIDVSPFGIERFDLKTEDWRNRFRSWLDSSRASAAFAP
ncbi:MAG TPA: toll/interleukin-1 receptor domain-containing protein [Xanthobacteraceae bacterium]|nr:toll/interleukin-1 receptor domain-containing protein [Xanthobacteraceae bacterium]